MILKILFAHMLGDYFLQTDYIAKNKGTDLYLLLVHAVLYTFGVLLVFGSGFTYGSYVFICVTHFMIDYLKASGITVKRFGAKRALVLDQAIHYATLILLIFMN
ncbi:hypothetical protein UT300009_30040 [Paraclostridium bifermentans]